MSPPPATSAAASVPAPLDPAGALVVMPDSSAGDARRVSELLAQLGARLEPGRISLGEIVAALGSRSLGSFLLVLAIPTVMPVPLGLSVLFNLPVLIYALQLARGRGTLGLPRWLMRRSIDTGDLKHLISRTLALLRQAGPQALLTHVKLPRREVQKLLLRLLVWGVSDRQLQGCWAQAAPAPARIQP